jgi:MerR family mercuric resistance operon transcriptional regulator
VIKAAQRLGFSLDEVAELLETGRHRHRGRPDAGLRQRAAAKLAEVEAKIAHLNAIADTLRAALDAGCGDLMDCAGRPHCPLPFTGIAEAARQPRLPPLYTQAPPS